jgi:dihydropteroate synthase
MKRYTLSWLKHTLILGPRTTVMGIVNVTPDSFSDGGRFDTTEAAITQGKLLADAGAGIIDIGGESTRPFAPAVSAEEEMARVLPVIEHLASRLDVPISIDTTKAEVARRAAEAGAAMINDISALTMDPEIAQVAASHQLPLILMHMKGTPRTMQLDPTYDDVVAEVRTYLRDAIDRAVSAGVPRERVIIDPGIGFGKTGRHNMVLIRQLKALDELDVPILVGPSRKRFIRDLVKPPGQEDIAADCAEVENGTLAAVAAAILNGAHIVRVHDVARTMAMVKVLDAIRTA